ncbi:MAG TPA: RNA polymerase sigma factor FliA [Kofleriaceae bacterium]|jgi:RNA polymerase sigma factor for flagellar operon FliA|nr:RNA polymerase sigma factor FliA [Kofleriaceae bacterium]
MKAYATQNQPSARERDRLIAEHVEIARRISLRIARSCPDWISRDDIVAAGMLGLAEAAERYDETRAEPFLSFAEKRIRGAVIDELRRGDLMPRRMRRKARQIGDVIQKLEQQHGEATDEAIAEKLGVSVEEYRTNLEQIVHVTVGALEMDDDTILPTGDESSPELSLSHRRATQRIRDALAKLDQRDLLLLNLYYTEELTYTEIGEVLDVTRSRVCQLHGRAIARLRSLVTNAGGSAEEAV